MVIIGLTGGIASGKSTVSDWLHQRYGAEIMDTDAIAWALAEPGQALWQQYVERYGRQRALNEDGTLNRRAIGGIVFADPREKEWTDAMSHPLIQRETERRLQACRQKGCPAAVLDVPLLFEAGWDAMADEVWVVYVKPDIQLARLMARNGYSEAEARDRIASQMAPEERNRRADVVIDNSGTQAETRIQVDAAWSRLMKDQGNGGGTTGAQAENLAEEK